MKKTALSLCLLIMFVFSCAVASAEQFTGGSATLDVPSGWEAAFQQGNPGQLRLSAPEGGFRMVIMMGTASGMSSEQGARRLAKSLNGTEPKPTQNPDVYAFEGQSGNPRCLVMVKGKRMVAVMEGGDRQAARQQIGSMMQSLASSDSDEQGIFDALKPFFNRGQ